MRGERHASGKARIESGVPLGRGSGVRVCAGSYPAPWAPIVLGMAERVRFSGPTMCS